MNYNLSISDYEDYYDNDDIDEITVDSYDDYDDYDDYDLSVKYNEITLESNEEDDITAGDYEDYDLSVKDNESTLESYDDYEDNDIKADQSPVQESGDYEDCDLSVKDNESTLESNEELKIIKHPESQKILVGNSVSLSVEYNKNNNIKIQWYKNVKNKKNIKTSTPVAMPFFMMSKMSFPKDEIIIGANNSTYTIDTITYDDDGDYYVCVKDNNLHCLISNIAIISVI